jgi:hypothetical protein
LPPSARIGARGIVEVQETAIAPRAFVFVSEQRLLEPVRPTTVIVNNTTVINQTVNITKIQVVNQTVVNEGPRPEIIERKSGRKVEAVPVRELRRRDETEIAARRRNFPATNAETVQPPVRTEVAPVKTIPAREQRPVANPAEATTERPPQTTRNEVRKSADQNPAPNIARPGVETSVRTEGRPETRGEKARFESAPVDAGAKGRQEAKPSVLPREPRPQPEATQPPARKNEVREASERKPAGTTTRPEAAKTPGNARQRELERGKLKPATEQPAAARKPTQIKQAEKPATPAKEKPGAKKRGEATKKPDDKKKGDGQETPRPAAPPQSPP